MSDIPFKQRIFCSPAEAEQASGLGHTKLYELIAQGKIKSRKEGKKRLIEVESLLRLGADDEQAA